MRPHGPRALLRNKENPELERIPGLGCRPQAALRPRCCPSVPQGPARPPPRAELSARSLHISNTPPARHARTPTAAVPAPLSSDTPPDLALGPAPAGPPELPSPEGASERRPRAECRRTAVLDAPRASLDRVGPGPSDRPSPPPAGKSPRAALPGPEEAADPGEVTQKVPKLGGGRGAQT